MLRYFNWLHLQFPAARLESLPIIDDEGKSSLKGVRITGDLRGNALLKTATHSGTQAVNSLNREIQANPRQPESPELDIAILGGGVSGISAALRCKELGLKYKVLEANELLSTIRNFPKGKPIYRYPLSWDPGAALKIEGDSKEALLDAIEQQATDIQWEKAKVEHVAWERSKDGGRVRIQLFGVKEPLYARRAIIAIGKAGAYRLLDCPGAKLPKVVHRLYDPTEYKGKRVLVVGGGDSAAEAALNLNRAGAKVTIAHRGSRFERIKESLAQGLKNELGQDNIYLSTQLAWVTDSGVTLRTDDGKELKDTQLDNDIVIAQIGREAPAPFLRRCKVAITGTFDLKFFATMALALAVITAIYSWKNDGGYLNQLFTEKGWFPYNLTHPTFKSPGFFYELLYTGTIITFGIRRIRRRKTEYVTKQTLSLMAFQTVPLFLLPYFILPWLGDLGLFDSGFMHSIANELFPRPEEGAPREFWRSVGFVLAWPLFLWNVFTPSPMTGWLIISLVQTFVLIPLLVWKFGKGVYCGWICSCGALAETLGDMHRKKMPHGRFWNGLNISGQIILFISLGLLVLRVAGWYLPDTWKLAWLSGEVSVREWAEGLWVQGLVAAEAWGFPINYYKVVDYFLSGIIGIGLYFHFSGRSWCRFFCPLASLMNFYSRFSRFRIFPEKSKCISCAACSTTCHQGIHVMAFAVEGKPMNDPQCVRCSACVNACPTGVLQFGELLPDGTAKLDKLIANPLHATKDGTG